MDSRYEVQKVHSSYNKICSLGLRLLWHFVHVLVSLWYFGVYVAEVFESCIMSCGLLKHYKKLNVGHIRYLAIVVESEEAYQIGKVIQLLKWLEALGVKQLCLYDVEGVLKKSKKSIIEKLESAILLEECVEEDLLKEQKHMILEFASISDGKDMVAKAANLLFLKYSKLAKTNAEEAQVFTEANLGEALRAIGCKGQDPDLMLVYGPVRCHLGFPAWRIRFTEIIHMGSLKSMRHGSLLNAIRKFTFVQQNYGKKNKNKISPSLCDYNSHLLVDFFNNKL
ncbi:hypothetical protein K2173_013524 [Erythroxylum novogranatense]|uniref:ditrans,polycis-polyprenyl diphosphate synthase [(2E,6E)-farnesyldiphosphate specific] n=1 Tax=Erythroxylum novogranatense TaxID=1862640 RepID=A0AAV8TJP0_9ROSI|nr:hypothetical protein K2173_013524 [Erythroxylum novogranatense]